MTCDKPRLLKMAQFYKPRTIPRIKHYRKNECIHKHKSMPIQLVQSIDNIGNSLKYSRKLKLYITSEDSESQKLLGICESIELLKERWIALSLFSVLAFSQSCIWNTWGPVAESTIIAFPSWTSSTVALLSNWGCITYLIFCFPCCWLLYKKDLLIAIRVAAIFTTVATLIRCISSEELIFSTTAHVAAILNGISGVIIGPATALVSAIWFPLGKRTIATGISFAANELGVAIAYLIGPAVVKYSSNKNIIYLNHSNNVLKNINREMRMTNDLSVDSIALRVQIMSLMRIEFVIQLLILCGILWFYPKNPSQMSSKVFLNTGLLDSTLRIIRNKYMWLLALTAALSQGVTGPWLTMITFTFGPSVTQNEADNVVFWTIVFSSLLNLVASYVMDSFHGHFKITINFLLVVSSAMFLWILLINSKVLILHKNELYVAVILGISVCWSTPALLLELASEVAFPVSEAIVGGFLIFLINIVGFTFYSLYFIPGIGENWSSYCIFVNLMLSSILIICVKDEYNRTKMSTSTNSIITLFTNEEQFKLTKGSSI